MMSRIRIKKKNKLSKKKFKELIKRIRISLIFCLCFLALSGCATKAKHPILISPCCEVRYYVDTKLDGSWITATKKFNTLKEAEEFAKDKKWALIVIDNGAVSINIPAPAYE